MELNCENRHQEKNFYDQNSTENCNLIMFFFSRKYVRTFVFSKLSISSIHVRASISFNFSFVNIKDKITVMCIILKLMWILQPMLVLTISPKVKKWLRLKMSINRMQKNQLRCQFGDFKASKSV